MKYLILIPVFIASGCATSDFVAKEYNPKKSVVLKYLNNGADFVIKSRHEDAIKKAKVFCSPQQATLNLERNADQLAGLQKMGNMAFAVNSNYNYLHFSCD